MNKYIYSLGIVLVALVLIGPSCLDTRWSWRNWIGGTSQLDRQLETEAVFEMFEGGFDVQPRQIKKKHIPNKSKCVDKLDSVKVTGPEGSTFHIVEETKPDWLDISELTGITPAELKLDFNCRITEMIDQEATVEINNMGPDGFQVDTFFNVSINIEVQK